MSMAYIATSSESKWLQVDSVLAIILDNTLLHTINQK